ncbi:hypothetical protein PsorP6_004635 [Peronosclerospora sorghi]|uniref:Uncharacterized protein n=1 Tax=Peronosclerospora sorghi TaxID=230839 RepID=A0ACC0VLL2_9STRA|nr:hypothetical protein PsorP6_004635 [Peronosclerospora sorghi]
MRPYQLCRAPRQHLQRAPAVVLRGHDVPLRLRVRQGILSGVKHKEPLLSREVGRGSCSTLEKKNETVLIDELQCHPLVLATWLFACNELQHAIDLGRRPHFQSIQGAIRHARQVRAELAIRNSDVEKECETNDTWYQDTGEKQLHSILAIANETRAAQRLELKKEKEQDEDRFRLAYPKKLKSLEECLKELWAKEKEMSTRFSFCCKMNEHLAMGPNRRKLLLLQQGCASIDCTVRVQTSFPKQVSRLRLAYQRLVEFLLEKVGVGSHQFQQIASAPSFSTVFPTYQRIKQAKNMYRLLNNETKSLLERLPKSTPKLSHAAVAHRDAMLARICKKKSHPEVGVIDNKILLLTAREAESYLRTENKLLEKLQAAWVARKSAPAKNTRDGDSVAVYSTTVREIVLTELSEAVLWSFKTYIADTAEQPDATQIQAVMRLI